MCTLALLRGVSRAYPLIVAANRDELYARPSEPPCRLTEDASVVAGRDLEAGGTWLGARVDRPPLIAGILNRSQAGGRQPSRRGPQSRGMLCLRALLEGKTVDQAAARFEREAARVAVEYGDFHLVLADLRRCVVADNAGGTWHARELEQGVSVLTNLAAHEGRCPRRAAAARSLAAVAERLERGAALDAEIEPIRAMLADHDNALDAGDDSPFSRVCVHTEAFGTRSSSLIAVGADARVRYFHCEGPPCRAPLRELEL